MTEEGREKAAHSPVAGPNKGLFHRSFPMIPCPTLVDQQIDERNKHEKTLETPGKQTTSNQTSGFGWFGKGFLPLVALKNPNGAPQLDPTRRFSTEAPAWTLLEFFDALHLLGTNTSRCPGEVPAQRGETKAKEVAKKKVHEEEEVPHRMNLCT